MEVATVDHAARRTHALLALIVLLGLLIRLPFLPLDFQTTADPALLRGWARLIQQRGLLPIYDGTTANYPPLFIYMLAGVGAIEAWLPASLRAGDQALNSLIKLLPALADLLGALLIARAFPPARPGLRALVCALYALNPAIWYVSAHWGQVESIYTLFLLASMIALRRGRVVPAWLAFALSVAAKPQPLVLAPLLVAATLQRYGLRALARGALAALAAGALLAAPWLLTGRLELLVDLYTFQNKAPRLVVSAYNLWYLLWLGRVHQVSSLASPAGLALSFYQIGLALFVAFEALVITLGLRMPRAAPALLAVLLSMGAFMLLTQMHERYLYPALAFTLLAAGETQGPGRLRSSLWWAYGLLSLSFFYNLITIAPFTALLGTNLVAASALAPGIGALQWLALLAAATNLLLLGWLLLALVGARGDREVASQRHSATEI